MTLDELITELTKDGKRPDDIRVRRDGQPDNMWLRPYFKAHGRWYGVDSNDAYFWRDMNATGYELYTEPKPKVKRAQYLVHIKGFDPYITDTLHANEKSVQLRNLTGNPFVICERLMETEREFDE